MSTERAVAAKRRFEQFARGALVALAAFLAVFLAQPGETGRMGVAIGGTFVASLAALVALLDATWRSWAVARSVGRAWVGLAAAQACLVIAGILTGITVQSPARHFPAPADVFFFASIPLIYIASQQFSSEPLSREDRPKMYLEGAIVAISAALVLWNFVIGPRLQMAHVSPALLAAVAYPVGNFTLMWVVHVLLYRPLRDQPRLPIVLLQAFVVLMIALSSSVGLDLADGWYTANSVSLLLWVLAYTLLALAGVAQRLMVGGHPDEVEPPPVARVRTLLQRWLPYGWMTGAYLLVVFHERLPMDAELLTLCVGGVLLLLMLRQQIAFTENARLAQQLQEQLRLRQRAQSALEELNTALEGRVNERTAELTLINDELRREMTERERAEEALRVREEKLLHNALHDALTGLPNRTLFAERVERAIERARRHDGFSFAVLFLDFDGFKVINDSLGHRVGDVLLTEIARRLQAGLRGLDTVARLGGDEFVILLDGLTSEADAGRAAERIQQSLAQPFGVEGHKIFTSASIGIVLGSAGYVEPADILRDADLAMYQAKFLGKARHAIFTVDMRAQALARLMLETELRSALEQNQLCLHYQPILSLQHNQITGFEALIRWKHPERSFISPVDFIPVAEATGLILPIGQWVLREACRQMAVWHAEHPQNPPLSVSVNLSAKQFAQHDLPQQVERALAETGLPAACLKLEITESAIIDDMDGAVLMLNSLRALGVQVQIDDFGTGYSSLSYLHRFPIDTLKIDRTFINRMRANGDNTEIVRTITALARDLEMMVIAEGVETAEQLALLKDLHCEFGQGYFISKPLDPQAARTLIADHFRAAVPAP